MFDISFTELMFVGVVALVVIGPEKLPKVARTVGHLVGRAQRYVSDVKGDIQREVELDELRKMKDEMESAAQSMKSSFHQTEAELKKELDSSTEALSSLEHEMKADYEPTMNPPAAAESPEEPAALPAAKAESGLDNVPPSGAAVKGYPAKDSTTKDSKVKESSAPSSETPSPSGVESKP